MAEPTKDEIEALNKDVENFNAELIPILAKYNLGLGASSFVTPDGRIGARPSLFRPSPADQNVGATADQTAPAKPAAGVESSEA